VKFDVSCLLEQRQRTNKVWVVVLSRSKSS